MKTLFKTLSVCALCILLALSSLTVFAAGSYDIRTDVAIQDAAELELVRQAVLTSPMVAPSDDFKNLGGLEAAIDFTSAYKAYDMNCDFISGLENGKSLAEMAAKTYAWYVPAQNNQTIAVTNSNGTWSVESVTTQPANSDSTTVIDLATLQTIIDKLAQKHNVSGLSALILDDTFSHYTTYLYLQGNDFEYVIPYSARTDWTGLTNGKLYTPDEIYGECKNSFAELDTSAEGIVTGQNTEKNAQVKNTAKTNAPSNEGANTLRYVIIGAVVIAALAILCIALLKKKKA